MVDKIRNRYMFNLINFQCLFVKNIFEKALLFKNLPLQKGVKTKGKQAIF